MANKRKMSFNVDKCSVMHMGHNNMQSNYNMSNKDLPRTDQLRDLGIIITEDVKLQKQTENRENGQQSTGVYCPRFQVQTCNSGPHI